MHLPKLHYRLFAAHPTLAKTLPTKASTSQQASNATSRTLQTPNTTTIFLHGYLGSHKNFANLSKYISSTLQQNCVTLDLRNHGLTKPQVDSMSYQELAGDLDRFIREYLETKTKANESTQDISKETENQLHNINLVGYSMGAKTILEYILNPKFAISRETGEDSTKDFVVKNIVCLDNSPMRLDNLGAEFHGYITMLKDLDQWHQKTFNTVIREHSSSDSSDIERPKAPKDWRKQSLSYLQKAHGLSSDLSLYFVDLFHIDPKNKTVDFKINKYLLSEKCLYELNDFADYRQSNLSQPQFGKFNKIGFPSLFVEGLKSDFITEKSWEMIEDVFEDVKLESFDCDHKDLLVSDTERLKTLIVNQLRN